MATYEQSSVQFVGTDQEGILEFAITSELAFPENEHKLMRNLLNRYAENGYIHDASRVVSLEKYNTSEVSPTKPFPIAVNLRLYSHQDCEDDRGLRMVHYGISTVLSVLDRAFLMYDQRLYGQATS